MDIDRLAPNGDGAGAAEEMDLERPFLRRSSSGSRRRRTAGETPLGSPSRRPSFRQEMGHAAAETYLITRLTLVLLRYLGYPLNNYSNFFRVGSRWITKFLALGFYALLLMPGFIQGALLLNLVLKFTLCLRYSYDHLFRFFSCTSYKFVTNLLDSVHMLVYTIKNAFSFPAVGYYYFFSNQVRRSVIYGEQPRNR
ncbi:hypothetical protein B296_00029489 [Ensete ventricosum]|uniref:Uncharacterized protein n=1 Tax=Ensete ventricosum TaxID=4639 RepID=A0A427AL73_ENSVE|nr:hypothetical protein B296_00029489 [Ensete ventricosum]